jgi:hypothetical protein
VAWGEASCAGLRCQSPCRARHGTHAACGGPGMCSSRRVGDHPSNAKGMLAASLGRDASGRGTRGASRREGGGDSGPGTLRRLALDGDPGPGMASVAAREPPEGMSSSGRNRLESEWSAGAPAWSQVEGERGVE